METATKPDTKITMEAHPRQAPIKQDATSVKDHGEEAERGVVELSAESIQAADIHVTALKAEFLPEIISAPGEIRLDQYRSAEVTPLIDAVVIKRHARLGDEVKAGQPPDRPLWAASRSPRRRVNSGSWPTSGSACAKLGRGSRERETLHPGPGGL